MNSPSGYSRARSLTLPAKFFAVRLRLQGQLRSHVAAVQFSPEAAAFFLCLAPYGSLPI